MAEKYEHRFYRLWSKSGDLVSFEVTIKETGLFVSAQADLSKQTEDAISQTRQDIEGYIRLHPKFKTTLTPLPDDKNAPQIVRQMLKASLKSGVGPMAAVAGAIAEEVGNRLLKETSQVIVENGGDIFISSKTTRRIGIFAGESPLSNKLAVEISAKDTPCGICTSSATVGPSLSFGKADAALIYSRNCALADAAATAVGNIVKSKDDIKKGLKLAEKIKGVEGALIIIKDTFGAWGSIKIVDIT